MANFNELIRDIYRTIENPEFEISEDSISVFLENIGAALRDSFGGRHKTNREPKLVASNFGLPPRRLWYSIKSPQGTRTLSAMQRINFLYGNILEELVLLLVKESGHEVQEEQKRIVVNGVSGKKDARIDGVVTDVKSASSFSFRKFKEGDFLLDDEADPFGYKYQLGLYMQDAQDQKGAFLVINKENGELLSVVLNQENDVPDVHLKIEQARILLERDTPPPEKCYPDEVMGKSGNRIIHKLCTFCDFRDKCWSEANDGQGLIKHFYANGPVWFTKVVRDPKLKGAAEDSNGTENNS